MRLVGTILGSACVQLEYRTMQRGTKRQQKGTKNYMVYLTMFFLFSLMVEVVPTSNGSPACISCRS